MHGHLSGLKPSQIKQIERLTRRRCNPAELIGPDLARALCELSSDISRQIGLLIDRKGHVAEIVVGTADKLDLPDLGRHRAGRGRFRGLRLVHTHLSGEPLSQDDLTDLALLRLDCVAALTMDNSGLPSMIHLAHLIPKNPQGEIFQVFPEKRFQALQVDFLSLIEALEEEFRRTLPKTKRGVVERERAVLIGAGSLPNREIEHRMAEMEELARAADVEVIDTIWQKRAKLDPKTVIGRGKLEQVVLTAMQNQADLLIFETTLGPAQIRAIGEFSDIKVIDRSQLILDVFARHAQTRDGKLQVELAQLKYRLPRLGRNGKALSRLMGGIGGRGPGEQKLEIDRRRVRERISRLEKEIELLAQRRERKRARRERRNVPTAALVGYTNVGKSTLLNRLTASSVFVENKYFATLDPSSRRLRFPQEREIVLTDTVGFIRDLPDELKTAFRATLEELHDADFLLHVVDSSSPDRNSQVRSVSEILDSLGLSDIPKLLLYNKVDLLDTEDWPLLMAEEEGFYLSAKTGDGLLEFTRYLQKTAEKGHLLPLHSRKNRKKH